MRIKHTFIAAIAFIIIQLLSCNSKNDRNQNSADVVICGGTSAGISSAIQTARLGKQVILIEPTNRLGGLITQIYTDYTGHGTRNVVVRRLRWLRVVWQRCCMLH
ncbi:MAG TPA: FAD-dependent oxidoreductase [Bacteroidetes bacterium]|nr:FAD-dependent oxidoreductase [Bacteroidota bacterium]